MSDFNINLPNAPVGWQCPICKRVYSPYTPMCWYCGGESKTSTSTDTEDPFDKFVSHNYGYFTNIPKTEENNYSYKFVPCNTTSS